MIKSVIQEPGCCPVKIWTDEVERKLSRRFAENEYHVTIRLPVKRQKFFDVTQDYFQSGAPAMLIAFGRVKLAGAGFHARGGIIHLNQRDYRL
jgi:hypothetical protein